MDTARATGWGGGWASQAARTQQALIRVPADGEQASGSPPTGASELGCVGSRWRRTPPKLCGGFAQHDAGGPRSYVERRDRTASRSAAEGQIRPYPRESVKAVGRVHDPPPHVFPKRV